ERIKSAATIAAPAPEPIKPAPTISAMEIATLVSRGEALLARSDVSSARLFFARAALAGDAQAATRLAVTYDPDFIAQAHLPVRDIIPAIFDPNLVMPIAISPILVLEIMGVRQVAARTTAHIPLENEPVIPSPLRVMGTGGQGKEHSGDAGDNRANHSPTP